MRAKEMSREIKFREWGRLNKRMIEWQELSGTDLWCVLNDCEQWIVMQFTGLHDKNGKEIYESDIIKHLKYGGVYEVVYSTENTGYDLRRNDHASMHLCSDCQPNLEVIGNIYENPTLLESK